MVSSVPRNSLSLRFQLLVQPLRAANETHGGQAVAPLRQRLMGGRYDGGVVGQAQVVVRAQV